MAKLRSTLQTMNDFDDMDNLIWNNACRYSLDDFCRSGGFTSDALQEFIDLAREGFQRREESKQKKEH